MSMYIDSPGSKGKNKRAVDEIPPAMGRLQQPPAADSNAPRILRRYQHRHRNVATEVWGPEIPSTTASQTSTGAPAPKQPFSVYKAILRHPNLFFQFALRVSYPSIIDLYAIDKEFHYRLNLYSVSLIHDYARYHAPLAGYIFSWVLYPHLCISDPMLRPMDGREWLARDVPGFRWVGMILWRQKIVRSILTILSLEGHRVPASCEGALMKFWGLMELSTTKLRLSFLEDAEIWTDADIINIQLFFVKLDMRFSDPILGNGVCQLGSLLLGQRSLETLWQVLSGKLKLDYDNTSEIVVKTYLSEDLDVEAHPWLEDEGDTGVPEQLWGLLNLEGWNEDGEKMMHAVDMVITESVRRELHVQQYYLDFVLYGWVDAKSGENNPIPRQLRRDKKVVLPSKGWPSKELRQSTIETLDVRFGLRKADDGNMMDLSI
ncbi:hypothetical protein G6011_03407 [Alternaria panax]|uniref:Uncharacterized protein n=1 Tax=Alternaria panax TaxID=48097 RepID=A0AAD4NST8_9PLEO|nr:hypothetical protein G6011_03407 [Alternaria panax]